MTSKHCSFDPLNIGPLETDLQDLDVLLNSRPNSPVDESDSRHISPSASMEVDGNVDSNNGTKSTKRVSPTSHFLNSNFDLSNAVHMEVQENAKVPNLYHVPVRRSGGHVSRPRSLSSSQQQLSQNMQHLHHQELSKSIGMESGLLDEILRLSEEDLTLTENFLGKGQR